MKDGLVVHGNWVHWEMDLKAHWVWLEVHLWEMNQFVLATPSEELGEETPWEGVEQLLMGILEQKMEQFVD